MLPFLAPLIKTIGPALLGRAAEVIVTDSGKMLERKTKGLIRSKTAHAATYAMGAKIVGVFLLPLPAWLQYSLVASVFIEWAASIYLRVRTDTPI